ncbi:MAG: LPS-assembly protein LptD [Proteobacteria bacterium]|nr:LPS-assembly protein LptD [Pseudomonadota bacterium]
MFFHLEADVIKEPYVTINADRFEFDKIKDVVFAYDGVHVYYKKTNKIEELFCDKLVYDHLEKKIYALGNVILKDSDGMYNRSSSLEITDDFLSGSIESIHLTTKNEERFLADKGKKENLMEVFLKARYTPCKTCDKEDAFWEFSASEIIHDTQEHRVKYYHAVFSILGIPIFYTPYFSHYDSTIKRKSGLIFPQIGTMTDSGFYFAPSYFYVIDDYSDLTITPFIFTKDSPMATASYRCNFYNGEIKVASSFIKNKFYTEPTVQQNPLNVESPLKKERWNIFSKIGYDIDDKQRINFKLSRASDTTYFMKYPALLKNQPLEAGDLSSFLMYERFLQNYYLSAKSTVYQTALPKTTPVVLPSIFFEKFSKNTLLGAHIHFLFHLDHLKRKWGVPGNYAAETSRFYTKLSWDKSSILNNHVLTYKIEMNIVLEWLKNYKTASTPLSINNPTLFSEQIDNSLFKKRLLPTTSIGWSYPLINKIQSVSWIVEPKTMLFMSPYSDNNDFPNDDSRTLTLDNTTLFLNNRFDGYDRFDSGIRFVYGLNQKMYLPNNRSVEWFIGQTKRLDNRQIFPNTYYGEDHKYSDIVNYIKLIPFQDIKFRFKNAIDYKTRQQRFMEIGISAGKPIALFDFAYIQLSDNVFTTQKINQLNWQFSSKINDQWSCSYGEVRDVINSSSKPLKQFGSIVWQNDCLKVSTGIFKSNIVNNDIKPFTGFMIELSFKNLGAFSPVSTENYASSILSHF